MTHGASPGVYTASVTFNNKSPEGNVTYDLRATVVPIPEPVGLGLIGVALLMLKRRL